MPRLFLKTLICLGALALSVSAQVLNLHDDIHRAATLTSTTATLTGNSELHITGTGDPLPGCQIRLNSEDAWLFMHNTVPSQVVSTFLGRITVSGSAAVNGTNVRVVQHAMGAVVIPHRQDFKPLEVFTGRNFTGNSTRLSQYTAYNSLGLGSFNHAIRSFRLKRGYTATFAQNENGTGISRNFVAQDGDLEIGALPDELDAKVRFVRIFPWRWAAKKGIGGNIGQNLNIKWWYNWNLDQNSTLDKEYVAIRQTRWWPELAQNWRNRGINHLLGYNEPDSPEQANLAVGDAIFSWPDLLGTGLRVGAPAVTDGGLNWLYSFMDQADEAGLRVDFVPVHYYRSYASASDPVGATTQFYNFLKGVHDRVKRPLWVTEFNNGANWTTGPDPTFEQQRATVEKMIEMLDNTPFVERYAIYNHVEDVRRVQWDDGWPTAAGEVYRDKMSPVSYLQEIPGAGTPAVARYAFNGDVLDGSGNGGHAMQVGARTFVAGKHGQAIQLDGANDHLQLPTSLANTADFTFAAWVHWAGGSNWQRIIDFGNGANQYLFMTPRSGGGVFRFAIKNGGSEQLLSHNAALPENTWTHVAVTLSGNTGKLFLNGVPVATNTGITINPADLGAKLNYIGKSQFAADPLFNGRIDEARFFGSALADSQIAALAGGTPAPQFASETLTLPEAAVRTPYVASIAGQVSAGSGALTFAKLGGPAWLAVAADGTLTGVPETSDAGPNRFYVSVTDPVGNSDTAWLEFNVAPPLMAARYPFNGNALAAVGTHHATTAGSPAYTAGIRGTAIDLDGSNDVVTLPAGVADSDEITIATWINWDGSSMWQRIFDFGNGTGEYLFLTPRSGGDTLRFGIRKDGVEYVCNAPQPATGQWVHVAATLGGGFARLFVDGVDISSVATPLKPSDIRPVNNLIGDSQFASDPFFNGRIDEFLIFTSALDAAAIMALRNGEAPVFSSTQFVRPAAEIGHPYESTLAGSATDPGPVFFSKVGGPSWLTIDADGRISGVPSIEDSGKNRFNICVTNTSGLSHDAALDISVGGAPGLAAHFQFDGTNADNSGGAAGTNGGAPVFGKGIFDQAIQLDGIDDHVTLRSGILDGAADLTIAARVRWNGGNTFQRIFDFGNNTSQYLFLTPRSGGTNSLRFAITQTGFGGEQRLEGPMLPVGEWTHVALTLAGDTGTLYINGAAVDSRNITLKPSAMAPVLNYLGKSQFAPDPYFNGSIDDFRIYHRGLAATEIKSLAAPSQAVLMPAHSYTAWMAGISFPPGRSGPGDDADDDGTLNLLEWLLGSDPLVPGVEGHPQAALRTAGELGIAGETGEKHLSISVRVRKNRPGVTLIAEAAATLEALADADSPMAAVQAGPAVDDGEFEILTWYCPVPMAEAPAAFMRLRAVME